MLSRKQILLNIFWPQPEVRIAAGQSVVIVGRRGSGKSTLMRWLLAPCDSVIVYDSKWDPEEEWSEASNYSVTDRVEHLDYYSRVALRCPLNWFNRSSWAQPDHPWGWALEYPLQRRNTIAVFDEALATWPGEGGHPGTHRLIQQGRSFGVTTIVGTQLANNIDTRLLRMAEHIFVLGPPLHKTDLDCIVSACRLDSEPLTSLKSHEIAWWHQSARRWVIFRKIRPNRPEQLVQRIKSGKAETNLRPRVIIGVPATISLIWLAIVQQYRILAIVFALTLYLAIRHWKGRQWTVTTESGTWDASSNVRQTLRPDFVAPKRNSRRVS